jgi:hypothetical protein
VIGAVVLLTAIGSCRSPQPAIEFTKVPAAAEGDPQLLAPIEGRVIGGKRGQKIVLYAKSVSWWIQPLDTKPLTAIQPDATWRNSTHPGTEYAALLVQPGYVPPPIARELPHAGGSVIAVAVVKGTGSSPAIAPPKIVHFSGYNWEVRAVPSERGGKMSPYDPANAWMDEKGFLHLKTTQKGNEWTNAEVTLNVSLGRGLYRFTVGDVSRLDPAAAMSLLTWDEVAADQHHREIDIDVGRWGDPANKNAQYVVQPFDEPANVVRFEAPPGRLTHSFDWEPGKVVFKTVSGPRTVASHEFTSGVPSPGGESLKMVLYVFDYSRIPARSGSEVVIEKFEYLP